MKEKRNWVISDVEETFEKNPTSCHHKALNNLGIDGM